MQQEIQRQTKSADLQLELKELSGRDTQLWAMAFLVLVVVALGLVAVVIPNVVWQANFRVDGRFLPQLFSGLIVLVVLLNLYIMEQRRRLNANRERILRQVILSEAVPMIDPLTNAFSRQYVDVVVGKETNRADRQRSVFSVTLFELTDLKSIRRRFGDVAGDQLLSVLSQLLKGALRLTDTVCRYDDEHFLVAMPDTTEEQARIAVHRVADAVATWNDTTQFRYKIDLNYSIASHCAGAAANQVLEQVLDRMRQGYSSVVPSMAGMPADVSRGKLNAQDSVINTAFAACAGD